MEIILILQLQMEKLPSRKAITEMINWMSNVEHQTADEDSGHSLSSASQVRNLLHKYKVITQKKTEAFSLNKEGKSVGREILDKETCRILFRITNSKGGEWDGG